MSLSFDPWNPHVERTPMGCLPTSTGMSMHIQYTHTQNEYGTDENQKQRLKKYFNCVGETKEMKRKEKAKTGKAQGSE